MVIDMRQTAKPVASLNGLSSNPVHTIQSHSQKNTDGPRSILTASSIGLSLWNVDCHEERYEKQLCGGYNLGMAIGRDRNSLFEQHA
ncbi:hypothetical protein CDL15_Pgr002019 [Punica granatum]|uniref:Uncharacterized protein n=1 Tax=Punica granatum TaxID=22663 RepID=A0A218XB53_PUNGR|nr:hypothetical protein CDL15_Pgr002019 [Punica granatum]